VVLVRRQPIEQERLQQGSGEDCGTFPLAIRERFVNRLQLTFEAIANVFCLHEVQYSWATGGRSVWTLDEQLSDSPDRRQRALSAPPVKSARHAAVTIPSQVGAGRRGLGFTHIRQH
jgi:hypothetical protein